MARSEALLQGQQDALQRQVELLSTSSAVNETVAATQAALSSMQAEVRVLILVLCCASTVDRLFATRKALLSLTVHSSTAATSA